MSNLSTLACPVGRIPRATALVRRARRLNLGAKAIEQAQQDEVRAGNALMRDRATALARAERLTASNA